MGSAGQNPHLRFEKMPLVKGAKLSRYRVINGYWEQQIGNIHWRGGWHQYVFTADVNDSIINTIKNELKLSSEQLQKIKQILNNHLIDMARSCHKQIDEFIDNLMKEWRNSLSQSEKEVKK